VHTSAFPWNIPKRRQQLEELQEAIERQLPVSFDDIVIMGDLNLRRPEEEALIPEGYLDIWPTVRSGECVVLYCIVLSAVVQYSNFFFCSYLDPGYTFDTAKNKMICEAWPLASSMRRMRLDRILLKSNPRPQQHNKDSKEKEKEAHSKSSSSLTPLWVPESMRLFAHQPVNAPIEQEDEDDNQEKASLAFEKEMSKGGKPIAWFWWAAGWVTYGPRVVKTLVASSFDMMEINAFRNVDDYLWPSDHFGLVAVLSADSFQRGVNLG